MKIFQFFPQIVVANHSLSDNDNPHQIQRIYKNTRYVYYNKSPDHLQRRVWLQNL